MTEATCKTCRWLHNAPGLTGHGSCLNPINDRIGTISAASGKHYGVRQAKRVYETDDCGEHTPKDEAND